ncbi:MAG TPA: acetate--CoA ligase family protein, partial [Hyphomicrobiaceae bacterium]|nr:acetate--CoA ligase family protein [Hyphomicrobiaceae bacterium]
DGARGKAAADRDAVARAIVALSDLAVAHPEIEELDVNPVFAGSDGVAAVDWLMRRRGDPA